MNCFRHEQIVAVAICKNCGRGVCSTCAKTNPNAVACSDACELEITQTAGRARRSYGSFDIARSSHRSTGVIYLISGGATILLAFFPTFSDLRIILVPIGVACVIGGVGFLRSAQRYGAVVGSDD